MNIADVRAQYPQYSDLSDADLVKGLHDKFYADMPFDQFAAKVGFQSPVVAKPEDPGILASFGLGFGREADKLYQGVKQASLKMMQLNPLNPAPLQDAAGQALADQSQVESLRDQGYKPLQQQHPLATAIGEGAPMVAMPMGASLKAAMAIGALPGLMEYGSGADKLASAAGGAAGGGVGYGIGKVIGAIASPAMKAASPETDRLAQVAAANNIPLDAAQITGNPVLQNAKAALASIPWTAGGQKAADATKQDAFNSAVLKYLGSSGKAATPDVMADAHAAIVNKMGQAANSTAITMDDAAVSQLANVEKTFYRRLPTDQKPVIKSYLDDLTNLIGQPGGMPGDVYNATRSELGQLAFGTDNATLKSSAKAIQGVLDSAFDRQAPADAVQAMKEARSEYSKYMTVADAMKKARTTDGSIPAKQIYAQAQQDIPGFERGAGGSFNDLVRAGRQFLPDPVGNSGTAPRMLYQNLLTGGVMSGLGAAGGQMSGEGPVSGALMGLGGFAISKGSQKALNSQLLSRYLTSSLLDPEQKALLSRMGANSGMLTGLALSHQP